MKARQISERTHMAAHRATHIAILHKLFIIFAMHKIGENREKST